MRMYVQFLIGLISLAILNFFFFLVTWNRLDKRQEQCTVDKYLLATSAYIQSNGKTPIMEGLKSVCRGGEEGEEFLTQEFRKAIENLLYQCQSMPTNHRRKLENPILTLFTFWKSNENISTQVFRNTLINWSMFLPKFNLVLFTNDSSVRQRAEDRGWSVFPIFNGANDTIDITYMLKTVSKEFKSLFYGFANYEILFVDDLVDSLHLILSKFDESESIFITGNGIDIEPIRTKDASSFENIQIASKSGGRINEDRKHFFITSNSTFTKIVPELDAIGTGNELMLKMAKESSITIDVSETVIALQQKINPKVNNSTLFVQPNHHVFHVHSKAFLPTNTTLCNIWKSYRTLCGTIDIDQRQYCMGRLRS